MAKPKPFTADQAQEFDVMTARLSPAARGVWITIRMQMTMLKTYVLEDTAESLGLLLRCPSDLFLTSLEEFRLKPACGLSVEYPLCNVDVTPKIRLCNEAEQEKSLQTSLSYLRVSKHRESKKKSELKRMPEEWNLSARMREYGLRNGMSNDTVTFEFEACRLRHADSLFTDEGWEYRTFYMWVLNWVRFGRKQVSNGSVIDRSIPPFPGPHDPMARAAWRLAYGDPKHPKARS